MISKLQLKYIQSLGQKKHRDEEAVFIAEGPKLVKEFLQKKQVVVKHVYALDEWIKENEKLLIGIDAATISPQELERISQLKTPNQVIAIVEKFGAGKPVDLKGKITVVLDTIQDPGNLGTIIRIADWFAVEQIICSPDCADVYNPKVVQASMGSIARVKVFYTDLPELLQKQEIRVYAAMLEGKDLAQMDRIKEGLILVGNESKGIAVELLQYANEKITIPKKGEAESLNAAVAVGIILSHIV